MDQAHVARTATFLPPQDPCLTVLSQEASKRHMHQVTTTVTTRVRLNHRAGHTTASAMHTSCMKQPCCSLAEQQACSLARGVIVPLLSSLCSACRPDSSSLGGSVLRGLRACICTRPYGIVQVTLHAMPHCTSSMQSTLVCHCLRLFSGCSSTAAPTAPLLCSSRWATRAQYSLMRSGQLRTQLSGSHEVCS